MLRHYLCALVLLLSAAPALATTPSIDSFCSAATSASSSTTLACDSSATVDGSNRALLVYAQSSDGTPSNISSVVNSCGSASLTQTGSYTTTGTYFRGSMWVQSTEPATGTCSVTVTWSSTQGERIVIAMWLQDVDQTSRFGSVVAMTPSFTSTMSVTGIAGTAGDLIIDCAGFGDVAALGGNWIPAAGQTEIVERSTSPTAYDVAACDYLAASGLSSNRSQTSRDNTNTTHSFEAMGFGIAVHQYTAPSAPTLSSPTPSGTLGTDTTATVGATTTDSSTGTFYVVVDDAGGISGITASQVKAGQDSGSATAIASCNASVSTSTPSCGVSGLTASTGYSYAAVHNNAGGDSNVVTGTFTTGATAASGILLQIMQLLSAANDDVFDQRVAVNSR